MKIIYEFEDNEDALLHIHARAMYIALLDIQNSLRNYRKHVDLTDEQQEFFEKLDDELSEHLRVIYRIEG